MKKIIRNIFLVLLAIIVVGVTGVCVYLFKPEPKTDDVRPTITDPSGNSYLLAKDEKGSTYAAVTDKLGNIWAAQIDEKGNIGQTVASLNGKYKKDDIPTTFSGTKIDETRDTNVDIGGAVVIVDEPQTSKKSQTPTKKSEGQAKPSGNKGQTTGGTKTDDTKTLRVKKYLDAFAASNYLMEFVSDDPDLEGSSIVCATKNGNFIITTKIEGMTVRMLYSKDKDKTYLLLDDYKKYCSVPQSMLGDDFSFEDMNIGQTIGKGVDTKNVKKDTVKVDGKQLNRESFGGAKNKINFYFDGDTLVRFDTISVDKDGKKETSTIVVNRFLTDVPDDTFEIPSNYGYINLSFLDSMMSE